MVADLSAPATFAPERVRRAFPGVGREGMLAWHAIGVSAFEVLATLAPYCCVVSKHGMRVPEPSQGLALCESREQKKQGQEANWREKNLSRDSTAYTLAVVYPSLLPTSSLSSILVSGERVSLPKCRSARKRSSGSQAPTLDLEPDAF
ncbi:unnamed protein product [Rangifer tarandus platyrhynchus]|uniref:Uncharacterized protein n=1 Tax=Rangifer tarandus platyrhynchus TaxID=3082113 RepID=A0ACB1MIM5_RANTA